MAKPKNIRVSFDYDNTLDRIEVQEYAKELVESGYEVWIVTSRYSNEEAKNVNWGKITVDSDVVDYPNFIKNKNKELFNIADEIGIPKSQILFTNAIWKYPSIRDNKMIWHLDDNHKELNLINKFTDAKGISCKGTSTWKGKCEKLLKKIAS